MYVNNIFRADVPICLRLSLEKLCVEGQGAFLLREMKLNHRLNKRSGRSHRGVTHQ